MTSLAGRFLGSLLGQLVSVLLLLVLVLVALFFAFEQHEHANHERMIVLSNEGGS